MIEAARIFTGGKIKTTVQAVQDNIQFWNELHQLGLGDFRQAPKAATWTIANCVLGVRTLEANVTEMHLFVARRQTGYLWFFGLQPEEEARACWNRILQLWPRELCGDGYQMLGPRVPCVSLDVVELVDDHSPSELTRMANIGEVVETRYGKTNLNVFHEHMYRVEQEVAAARRFRSELEAIPDLPPNALAEQFLAIFAPRDAAVQRPDSLAGQDHQQVEVTAVAPAAVLAEVEGAEEKRGPGRKGLVRSEVIYRLAKAQEAIEKKEEAPDKTWKEIAKEINWRPGSDNSGVKLLEDARLRLKRVRDAEDQETLHEVAEFRKEKKTIP